MAAPPKRQALTLAALLGGLALVGALAWTVAVLGREDPDAVPTSAQVARRVMSPFCPGLTLEECPSSQSDDLRRRIDAQIEAGATNREIDRRLVSDYGQSVLARPPQALSWIVPVVSVALGFGALILFLGLQKRRAVPAEQPPPDADPARRSRMLEDLRAYAEGTE